MLSCHESTRLLSQAQERRLTLGERAALRVHLAMCVGCRNFSRQMDILHRVSRAYAQGAGAMDQPEDGRSEDGKNPL